jgi:hypothetical protein
MDLTAGDSQRWGIVHPLSQYFPLAISLALCGKGEGGCGLAGGVPTCACVDVPPPHTTPHPVPTCTMCTPPPLDAWALCSTGRIARCLLRHLENLLKNVAERALLFGSYRRLYPCVHPPLLVMSAVPFPPPHTCTPLHTCMTLHTTPCFPDPCFFSRPPHHQGILSTFPN